MGLLHCFATASGSGEFLPRGSAAAFPQKSRDNSHVSDADSTKHSDLNGVDNGNKHRLPRDQDG
jgi:hypothetical protein